MILDCSNCEHEIDILKLNSALFESMMKKLMTMKALNQMKLDQLNLFNLQKPTRLMKKRPNDSQNVQNARQDNPEENSIFRDLVLENLFKLWNRQEVVVPVNPKM